MQFPAGALMPWAVLYGEYWFAWVWAMYGSYWLVSYWLVSLEPPYWVNCAAFLRKLGTNSRAFAENEVELHFAKSDD